jgi:putative tricarboxylic transport membrane protein
LVFVVVAVLWLVVPLLLKLRGKSVLVNDEG